MLLSQLLIIISSLPCIVSALPIDFNSTGRLDSDVSADPLRHPIHHPMRLPCYFKGEPHRKNTTYLPPKFIIWRIELRPSGVRRPKGKMSGINKQLPSRLWEVIQKDDPNTASDQVMFENCLAEAPMANFAKSDNELTLKSVEDNTEVTERIKAGSKNLGYNAQAFNNCH
ncbi:hypothetical protein CPB84DRAFT_1753794 [Gymnopilus junonius]|uniref:Uncharacterized protein n=1 Tax=Gymnopilus junonius TaxID=109634 RepID=A0A9P5N7N5_GYMJU|nr:hypothetical protein CPB84DRAFT_1753794 [Gymnopilus junonius]